MSQSAEARPSRGLPTRSARHVAVIVSLLVLLVGAGAGVVTSRTAAAVEPSDERVVVPMAFPAIGDVSWTDTWLACRSGCTRQHLGQDLMGRKMQELVAGFDGTVTYLKRDSGSAGNYVSIRSSDRDWTLSYLHLNNDTPGTDDGQGSADYAFRAGLSVGDRVQRGQMIGWMGDSGNAESSSPHVHLELRRGDAWSGTPLNAAPSLERAEELSVPVGGSPAPPAPSRPGTPSPSPSPSRSASPSPSASASASASPRPSPTSVAPRGSLDSVDSAGASALHVTGWAYDPDVAPEPVAVQVLIDGDVATTVRADRSRPDVAGGIPGATTSGFEATVPVEPGPRQVCVRVPDHAAASVEARHDPSASPSGDGRDGGGDGTTPSPDTDGETTSLGCRTAEAGDRAPVGAVDVVEPVAGHGVAVAGWAFDPDATDVPVTVTVRFNGVRAATVDADQPRPDVDAAWSVGEDHGFEVVVPARLGTWDVCLDAAGDGTTPLDLGCTTVEVTSNELNGLPRRARAA